ncbi:MAG TPA: NADH-quinone oxidoreductase subunit J [Candidatus Thermoplasmatota archaeon]|nr:NADH-quinone oxidoreductase subunit J [Candidatus Thermoplasmatota archaeon]
MTQPSRKVQLALAAALALLLFAVLALAIHGTPAWRETAATPAGVEAIADALFGPLVIPFEVLGVLLTAVMVGALVIARPLTVHGSEETSLVHPNLAPPEGASLAPPPADAPAATPGPSAAPGSPEVQA